MSPFLIALSLALLPSLAVSAAATLPFTLLPCPGGPRNCLVPDVALDDAGILHVVYGTPSKQALYTKSSDEGATWSPPLTLNGPQNVTTTMGERGPKLSVPPGCGGKQVYVVWADLWFSGAQTYARLAVSRDGGESFAAPVRASDMFGIDGVAMGADGAGGVLVAWHYGSASTPAPPNATQATWLYTAASVDHGASFSPGARTIFANGMPPVACSMCGMRVRSGTAPGTFRLAFRSAVNNVRQHWVATTAGLQAGAWAAENVPGSWLYPACPMNGPELVGGAVAYMMGDENQVFWAMQGPNGGFGKGVGTPTGQGRNERYPTAVASGGQVLMIWNEGPMAVEGTAMVLWALWKEDGTFTGESGVLGTSFAGTKATAWVGGGGAFFVMTTAE